MLKIRLPHPSPEIAEYRFVTKYQPTPDGATMAVRPLLCVTADAVAHCDHPFNYLP